MLHYVQGSISAQALESRVCLKLQLCWGLWTLVASLFHKVEYDFSDGYYLSSSDS